MDLISDYIDMVDGMVKMFGATHNMMHIHVGMAIYLGVQLLLRDRRASPFALATVITLELVHESIERLFYGSWRWTDTSHDILLTIMWPTVITAVGYYRRRRWHMMEKLRREEEKLRQANSQRSRQRRATA